MIATFSALSLTCLFTFVYATVLDKMLELKLNHPKVEANQE